MKPIDDKIFFHDGTLKICSSLDVNEMLNDCFVFFKQFMQIDGIYLSTYDARSNIIKIISMATDVLIKSYGTPILLNEKERDSILSQKDLVYIVNRPEDSPITLKIENHIGFYQCSYNVLHLTIQGELVGVVVLFVKGHDRFTKEHARLLKLLQSPFAIAFSNVLRYREVMRLKDMLEDDNQYLSRELHRISGDKIIGENFGLKVVMEMVKQVAPLDSHVMLLGETGSGKEVIANAVHYTSGRKNGPFIKVNCGAIPETLLDSELFGHEKGAFTGALALKRGRFERAHMGTIFLDEIGELPPAAQIRLLRVIQAKEFERVGGSESIKVDVRIITATHRDLEDLVQKGVFREDLWFRLNVFPIRIPPLRQRKTDIPALVNHFIERKSAEMKLHYRPVPAPGALERLQVYDWPGNIRELENIIEREMIQNRMHGPDVPLKFEEFSYGSRMIDPPEPMIGEKEEILNLNMIIGHHIQNILKKTNGKIQGKDGAAALMGVPPSTLRNRMRKLGIQNTNRKKRVARVYDGK